MKIKATIGAAAGAGVLATSMLIAAPATAAPSACNPGQGCTYEDANYGRGHINFNFNVKHYAKVGWWVPTNHVLTDNAASSAFNNGRTGQEIRLFDRDSYQGSPVKLAKGKGLPNLGSKGLNDKLTSACFSSYCK